jgi:hypothetical protein
MAQFLDALGLSPQWAHVTPGSGVVSAGATSTVGVAFDATGLVGGYEARVVVAGNDPITPEIVLPVALHVAVAPDIALSNFVLNYAPAFVGVAASDTLMVSNLGTDGLTVTSIASSLPDFTVDVASFALAPGRKSCWSPSRRPNRGSAAASCL